MDPKEYVYSLDQTEFLNLMAAARERIAKDAEQIQREEKESGAVAIKLTADELDYIRRNQVVSAVASVRGRLRCSVQVAQLAVNRVLQRTAK